MDVTQSLKDTENALRDFIPIILRQTFSADWFQHLGVTESRVEHWKERQQEDQRRLGVHDKRLIFYSDFYDLKTIFHKNWNNGFADVFPSKKEFDVCLQILERYRNPDAHRRELLPYQKHLVIGISGTLRTAMTSYRSNLESGEAYYARIESVHDNLGNSWAAGSPKTLVTETILRPGDNLEFVIAATDPRGEELEYCVFPTLASDTPLWSKSNETSLVITADHIAERQWVNIAVRSPRDFHPIRVVRAGKADDVVKLSYEVLPPRDS